MSLCLVSVLASYWQRQGIAGTFLPRVFECGYSDPAVAYLIIFIGIWGNSIPTMLVALTASLILRMIKLVKTLIEVGV